MSRRNLFVIVLSSVLLSLAILAGCGSSSGTIQPLGGGFTNSSLSGTYVMKQTGFFANGAGNALAFSETTVFTANGNGGLTINVDDGGPQGVGLENLAGTYSISTDGTGSLIFNNPTRSTYEITMIDTHHFYVIEGDTYAISQGYGVLQTSTATPSGTFVFKSHNFGISSRVGVIAISGLSFTSTQDLLNLGGAVSTQAYAGTLTAPDSNGRGSFILACCVSYNYYTVSPSEFYFMADPSSGSLEIGQADKQTATTLAAGSYVFGSSGETIASASSLAVGIHSAGVFTADGNGNITGGSVDSVADFNVSGSLPFTVAASTYTMDPSGNGNGTITLPLSNGSTISQVFWMVNPTTAYFLDNSSLAIEDGTISLQTGAPFSALTAQAALVMDGVDTNYKDRVGVFDPTSGTAFNWNQASNSAGIGVTIVGTNGTYTVSSNGRVAAVVNDGVTQPGVNPGVVFYLSSPNTGFMVQEDGADIGGAFTQQTSP